MDYDMLEIFKEISKKYDNDICADCNSELISHVNGHFKVALCDGCAFVHKHHLPKPLNFIKSLTEDQWQGSNDISILKSVNNRTSNNDLRQAVPVHYDFLTYDSCRIWRRYIIQEKYVNQQFSFNYKSFQDFPEGLVKEGTLWKRGKMDDIYRERYFVLDSQWLFYYQDVKRTDETKRLIQITNLDLYLVPDKMKRNNGLQLSFQENNSFHNIYVYSEDLFETINWYNVIKGVKLKKLKKDFPDKDVKTLLEFISAKIIKEGYMEKSGSKPSNKLRRRWFTLTENHVFHCTKWMLRYYKHPLESQPLGEIYIGRYSDGYQIDLNRTFTGIESDDKTFTLVTESRSYDLVVGTLEEKESWISCLKIALSQES